MGQGKTARVFFVVLFVVSCSDFSEFVLCLCCFINLGGQFFNKTNFEKEQTSSNVWALDEFLWGLHIINALQCISIITVVSLPICPSF